MSETQRKIEAAFGQRVYEYEDDNGVVYYSFTRHDATLTTSTRLRLRSRIGTHLVNFVVKFRQTGAALGISEDAG